MMATKNPIVTKKQLEDSGFDNLRDYMNNQRGLTRRDGAVAMRKGDMDIKSAAEKRSATRMADVAAKKPQAERRSDTRLRASKASATSSDEANMYKKGGMTKMGKVKTGSKPDGVIKKGGTKGKMIAMKMGGRAC
jgi:hypothetical protein